jgi:outer membrane receptor protein involved in Fe transport
VRTDTPKKFCVPVAMILIMVFLLPAGVLAQGGTGRITGTISDPTGAVIPGAEVTIINTGTGRAIVAITNDRGHYTSVPLSAAAYRVETSLSGFKTAVRTLRLEVDETAVVDIRLEIGEMSEQVEVTGAPPLLNTQNASQGEVIDERRVQDLPLDGRDYVQLALLSEGAIQPIGTGPRGGFSTGGIRASQNNYMLDGMDNNDIDLVRSRTYGAVRPSIDAIKEFKVQTNTYSAEFGRAAGGVLNVVTKSGTNQFHGSLFEFHRNDNLDARDFFNKKPALKAPFIRNQFGGTIGGPIIKNRAFFFFSYDDLRRRESSTFVSTIPTSKMQQGDFSEIANPIFDPATFDPQTGTRQPFPGNRIPEGRFDPIAAKVAKLFPAPQNNQLANNFTLTSSNAENVDLWSTRVDVNLTQSDTVFYRMNRLKRDLPAVIPLPLPLRGGGTDTADRGWNLGVAWDHTFSPTFLTSVRGGWNRSGNAGRNPAVAGEENLSKMFGIQSVDHSLPGGFAQFNATGFRSFGGAPFCCTERDSQNRQIKNDTSVISGDHTIKFGVDILSQQNLIIQPQRSSGVFTFNGRFTNDPVAQRGGNGFADFLLGIPDQFQLSNTGMTTRRSWYIGTYVQDDWKIRPGFTLNLGVRYDLILPPLDLFNRASSVDIDSDPNNPRLVVAKDGPGGRIARSLVATDSTNFAPRIGFAWEFRPRLVLRGGYGIFYEVASDTGSTPAENPPFFAEIILQSDGIRPEITLSSEDTPEDLIDFGDLKNAETKSFERHPSTGYAQSWNLNIQYSFAGDWLWQIGYFGTKGTHLVRQFDGNPSPPGPGNINAKRPIKSLEIPGPDGGIIGIASPLSRVARDESTGSSIFHSLQTKLERRFSSGLTLLGSYIFSRAIDDVCGVPGAGGPRNCEQDPTNLHLERALSNEHIKHRFVTSSIYELPAGKGRHWGSTWPAALDAVLGGWNIAGIVTLTTGQAFTVTTSGNPANSGQSNRPNLIGDPDAIDRTIEKYFNTEAFQPNARVSFGNVGRNTLIAPSFKNVDFSIVKNWGIRESVKVQFRLEAFNLFNRPQFGVPGSQLGTANFGVISGLLSPNRKLQAGVKILF